MTMKSWLRQLFDRPVRHTIRKIPSWTRLRVEALAPYPS